MTLTAGQRAELEALSPATIRDEWLSLRDRNWIIEATRPGHLAIAHHRDRLPVLVGLFTNDLAFGRLMRALRSAHHFSKIFI
jgi:hypothetical protein